MNAATVAVILLAALLVVVVIVVLAQRNSGGTVDARGKLPGIDLHITVSTPARQRADEHLQAAAEQKRAGHDLSAARAAVKELKSMRPLKILWVDDAPDGNVNEVLMLSSLSFSLTQATSSDAALRYLQQGEIDLVITDLNREGDQEAGVALLRSIRERGFLVPAVVYSRDPGERADRATAAGAQAILSNPAQLLQAILGFARVPNGEQA